MVRLEGGERQNTDVIVSKGRESDFKAAAGNESRKKGFDLTLTAA